MKRRDFLRLAGAAGAAAASSRFALAQQAKVPRIVVLSIPLPAQYFDALMQGLADHGYVDGGTISVERYTAPTNADLPLFAARAVSTVPDIIVALGSNPSLAARNATDKIPIVFAIVSDPVSIGLVSALARPDRNLTGTSNLAPGLAGKQLSILREVIPRLSRLVVMALPADPGTSLSVSQMLVSARAINVDAHTIDFSEERDLNAQFQRVIGTPRDVVFLPANTYFNNNRDLLFDLFLENKIAIMSANFVEGARTPFIGNICYGVSSPAVIRRSASFVHDILGGARPNDLPVEQPTVFDFAVNLDMSRKIGLAIPTSILAQAAVVIDHDIRAPNAAN